MLGSLERYSTYYQAKHKPRKLDWFHSLGTATLTARFPKGEKELSVSLYQATILLLFNDVAKMGYKEIKQQTSMGMHVQSIM
jgi:cullin 4